MERLRRVLLFYTTLCVMIEMTDGRTREQAKDLFDKLLTNYSMYVRPNSDQRQATRVDILTSILSLTLTDIKAGTFGMIAHIHLTWEEPRMTWLPGKHGGIKAIVVPKSMVWTPVLSILNPVYKAQSIGYDGQNVRFTNTGIAYLDIHDIFEASCEFNMEKFPFDEHTCTLNIGQSAYSSKEMNYTTTQSRVNRNEFIASNEWELTAVNIRVVSNTPKTTSFVIPLKMRRKWQFFFYIFVLPVLFIIVLNTLVFLLPADTGERVGYSVTCLLSMSVFLTVMNENLPPTSSSVSNLTFTLLLGLAYSVVICALNTLVLCCHHRDQRKAVPRWLVITIRALHCKRTNQVVHYDVFDNKTDTRKDGSLNHDKSEALAEIKQKQTPTPPCEDIFVSWKVVGETLDILCFWIMIIAVCFTVCFGILNFVLIH